MAVQSRNPKPIQPKVLMSKDSMREKSVFEIFRAVCANSAAATRFLSRSSSSPKGSVARRASSCPFSTFSMSASIRVLISVFANWSTRQTFARTRMQQRIGTTARSE